MTYCICGIMYVLSISPAVHEQTVYSTYSMPAVTCTCPSPVSSCSTQARAHNTCTVMTRRRGEPPPEVPLLQRPRFHCTLFLIGLGSTLIVAAYMISPFHWLVLYHSYSRFCHLRSSLLYHGTHTHTHACIVVLIIHKQYHPSSDSTGVRGTSCFHCVPIVSVAS